MGNLGLQLGLKSDRKLISSALAQRTVKSRGNAVSKENTLKLRLVMVHDFLKLPSMNFSKESFDKCLLNECKFRATKCICYVKMWQEVEPSVRSVLLIAYTEFTINLEKFISVAGSLYL